MNSCFGQVWGDRTCQLCFMLKPDLFKDCEKHAKYMAECFKERVTNCEHRYTEEDRDPPYRDYYACKLRGNGNNCIGTWEGCQFKGNK